MSRTRRTVSALVGLLLTIAIATTCVPAAFAQLPPDASGAGESIPAPPLPVVQHISYGSPIWVLLLVAAVAAALTVAVMLAAPNPLHRKRPRASHS
jgi:hypothetical protein